MSEDERVDSLFYGHLTIDVHRFYPESLQRCPHSGQYIFSVEVSDFPLVMQFWKVHAEEKRTRSVLINNATIEYFSDGKVVRVQVDNSLDPTPDDVFELRIVGG